MVGSVYMFYTIASWYTCTRTTTPPLSFRISKAFYGFNIIIKFFLISSLWKTKNCCSKVSNIHVYSGFWTQIE